MHVHRLHIALGLGLLARPAHAQEAAEPAPAHAQEAAESAPAHAHEAAESAPAHAHEAAESAPAHGEIILVSPVELRVDGPADLVSPAGEHARRERGLADSGFTTIIRVDDRAGETVPLAEALAETVGVHVRSLGGLGAFSAISVRGAPPGHTAVFVDGVPLARLGSAAVDLGRLQLDSFSQVELHRGAIPASLGGATQASALALMTELGPALDGRPLLLSIGGGSFGTRHLRARWLGGGERSGYHLGAGYAGSEGDFVYFDDHGTNLNSSDDRFTTRRNNGFDRADAVVRAGLRLGDWSVTGGGRGMWKRQGLPGNASAEPSRTTLTSWSQVVDGSARRDALFGNPALRARGALHGLVEIERYRDPDDQVGVGEQDRRYTTIATGAAANLTAELSPAHATSAGVEAEFEHFTDEDLSAASRPPTRGRRWELASTLIHAVRLVSPAGERARFEPAVRLDVSRTEPVLDRQDGVSNADRAPRTDVHLTPRGALWLRAGADLSIKASAGAYRRAPTAVELYGDRGALVGNPALEPETGESADLGLVFSPAGPAGWLDRIYVEAAGFAARSRDTIVWMPRAGPAAGPQNLGGALIWGGEVVGSARAARAVTVTADYTYLDSRQRDTLPSYEGKELPQRPRHQLHVRADLAARLAERLAVLFGDAALVSGNHLDPANFNRVPRRALFGAGLKLEIIRGLFAAVEGKNLTDARIEDVPLDPPPRPDLTRAPRAIADFFGYPLPGRAFYVTLQWEP